MSASAAPSLPFVPVQIVSAGAGGKQYYHPTIEPDGEPRWQPGDTDPISWDVSAVGWCHGDLANRRDHKGIAGRVFITGARVVVVSDHFVRGTRYLSIDGPSLVAGVASLVSQKRADRAAQGSFLVGQMRLPWIGRVVFGPSSAARVERGEVRLAGAHTTAFGDAENVVLLFKLSDHQLVTDFVEVLIERVRADRSSWPQTSDEKRAALNAIPQPASLVAANGKLASCSLPATWRVSDTSGAFGVHSSQSLGPPHNG